mmetsp:Transcript_26069/g.85685  ORF Transcript_26069/g.85685 Transcript_26069/m.85685 type:complete len:336 (-) Transcript_26069:1419-2426(-)
MKSASGGLSGSGAPLTRKPPTCLSARLACTAKAGCLHPLSNMLSCICCCSFAPGRIRYATSTVFHRKYPRLFAYCAGTRVVLHIPPQIFGLHRMVCSSSPSGLLWLSLENASSAEHVLQGASAPKISLLPLLSAPRLVCLSLVESTAIRPIMNALLRHREMVLVRLPTPCEPPPFASHKRNRRRAHSSTGGFWCSMSASHARCTSALTGSPQSQKRGPRPGQASAPTPPLKGSCPRTRAVPPLATISIVVEPRSRLFQLMPCTSAIPTKGSSTCTSLLRKMPCHVSGRLEVGVPTIRFAKYRQQVCTAAGTFAVAPDFLRCRDAALPPPPLSSLP